MAFVEWFVITDPTWRRAGLPLVLGILAFVIGANGGTSKRLETDGANRHAGPQRQRQFAAVEALQHDSPAPTGINTVGGDMHHQSQPRQAGATVQPADQVGGHGDRLGGYRQRQFAGVEEKRVVGRDPNLLAHDPVDRMIHFLARAAEVNVGGGVIVEHAKPIAQMQIHANAVDLAGHGVRLDTDSALAQTAFDVTITQPHDDEPQVF